MMTIMVYVYCPLTVNIYHNSHHGCYLAVNIVSIILKKPLTVNIYHNSHHGCYLAVNIVSNILKKAQGRKFEKE